MNLFKKKTTTTVIKEKTLAEELSSIQSVFRTAFTKAQALSSKISAKKEATNAKIAQLNAELAEINTVEKNTANFITNIEKFVLSK